MPLVLRRPAARLMPGSHSVPLQVLCQARD